MRLKKKITISINQNLAFELDEEAKARNTSRSALIEEAIGLLQKKLLEESLADGYRAMAEENLKIAEGTIHYTSEAMNAKD